MLNVHSEAEMYQAALNACILAASEGFPHLTIAEIIRPPHRVFDAAMARQVVIHMMVTEMCWPKRRVAETEQRSREAVNRAIRTIDERLKSLKFENHYRTISARASELLASRIREAA